jgi:uridine kinase
VDGFHNARSLRYARGTDSPEGYFHDSFDYLALKRALLDPLGPAGDRRFRTAVFDYRADRVVDAPVRVAVPNAIVLFDGVFLQRPELDGVWDVTIWVDAPFEVTVERAVIRDAQHGVQAGVVRGKYEARYVPGQRLYLTQCHPLERADIVVHNASFAQPRLVFREPRGA